MTQRVAVVTGGNKGIGFEIVKGLCQKFDGVVYLTARDVSRGTQAVEELKKEGLNPKFYQLDICDQQSLDNFKKYLTEQYNGLDVLVNNAAIAFKFSGILQVAATETFSVQAEQTIHVNYTQLLATCHSLFPLLRPHARVVNVSSSAGHLSRIPGEALKKKLSSPSLTEEELTVLMNDFVRTAQQGTHTEQGWPNSAYSVSKVGVSALSFLQQRAFDKDNREDLVVNAVHPGYVKTDMSSHKGNLSPEEGADAPLFCALLPHNVQSPRGEYVWWNRKVVDWNNDINV